ncbi:putative serine/threonine protein kinase KIC1 KNAG_0B04320 [Huiozyma naganishii CBS 8797]|uniref:non-specific serine/threonine protein kinase n=1 Tax=Huiozyma naganishii (strain ATCC MYA-139 / BCRC 22969 / CBS 8797 / KCTC 17520 / NBRC 10181 / NCYC 3082 / Yp74L-3) TaxID=1071383 RepID=J7S4X9_HUIN7|nr:hypothetical protein KNAG_0B04320 [Kazachstania naganishii CBS 8797]CCK68866.1 hypothetical protein KNAG_0B04320 [Kazachstania naganishii CBS 8797]
MMRKMVPEGATSNTGEHPTHTAVTSTRSAPKKKDDDINAAFRRTEVIGKGKFGVVYKGYNLRTKHVYAIKVLNLDSDEDEVEDVQREIQFLASLKQLPNVTRYYGSYLKNTSLWIIMEYCAGGSLRSLLRPGKIDEKYIGVIMRELLVALKFIHKDNIIHRDIKAANVLITNEGGVKLCDFGVAAQLNQRTLRRQTMAGTPYWMAPEVIMEGVYYDTKVDIWSLGITAYEISTGNPPYCDVEALRAMQLITKSKPPRLEGRNYTPLIKEFIALCLDEDPNERLSADELLKSKFIKAHKTTPTIVLKELITRYLLFRDKNNRESVIGVDDDNNKRQKQSETPVVAESSDNTENSQLDFKWDFDSLSSAEYILENNINVDAIPEENSEWVSEAHDQFNYAYPEEEQFSYYQTGNITKSFFQGTTIGEGIPTTMYHASTLNAPQQATNTGNYHSKPLPGTGTQLHSKSKISSSTFNTNANTSRRIETKAPKQLLDLFEGSDGIKEVESCEPEIPRISATNSASVLGTLKEDITVEKTTQHPASRPSGNPNPYYTQSTPSLPVLQTKFNKPSKGPQSAITSAPTAVEIEIPEELPDGTISTSTDQKTKPRSSTVSLTPLSYQQPPGLVRRLTVNNNKSSPRINESETTGASNSATDDISRATSGYNNISASNVHKRTPSPAKVLLSATGSPNKRVGSSPTNANGTNPASNLGAPPTMRPMTGVNESKDLLLHPLNAPHNSSGSSANLTSTSPSVVKPTVSEKEPTRVNVDFKKNNPNLKLQMPLPTTIARNKLLDPIANSAAGVPGNENINQFGVNTSSAKKNPVSMTPISEKHMDFGSALNGAANLGKVKRSPSVSHRKNSLNNEYTANHPSTSHSVLNAAVGATGSATASELNAFSHPGGPTSISNNSSNPGSATMAATMGDPHVMLPPPTILRMDMFQDVSSFGMGSGVKRHMDRKPQVLEELNILLQMFETGLPVIENTLKTQLESATSANTGNSVSSALNGNEVKNNNSSGSIAAPLATVSDVEDK